MTTHRAPTSAIWLTMLLLATVGVATAPTADAADQTACLATRHGDDVEVVWTDNGGRHVIRRDDSWLATPGTGVSSYTDVDAPQNSTYTVRTRVGDVVSDRTCRADAVSDARCSFRRDGAAVTITWDDHGGSHVLRRNGSWLATPGRNTDHYVDDQAPTGASYELRSRRDDDLTVTECPQAIGPAPDAASERVIHVSIDGLRVDALTPEHMPNLSRLVDEGAATMNARTDPKVTKTLPNHTSQLTGVAAKTHGIDYNEDRGRTVHDDAGRYISSVFDVVHDNGGRTVALVGKTKFELHDRTWDDTNGAPDVTGPDDGRDKIDRFVRDAPENTAQVLLTELTTSDDLQFVFFHIRYPDSAGHEFGWGTTEYLDAVATSDAILGTVLDGIDQDESLRTTTSVIVVADHGGPLGDDSHADPTNAQNYTIPFVVWGPTVEPGSDLYALNSGRRVDPGVDRLWLSGTQPIRGHEVANLALDLLGYPPVPGSAFNATQDLAVN